MVYNGKQIKKQITVETNSGGPEVRMFYGGKMWEGLERLHEHGESNEWGLEG